MVYSNILNHGLVLLLDFGLEEVLGQLKISSDFPSIRNTKNPKKLIPCIDDSYAIWLLYRDEAQKAKKLLYDGYYLVQKQLDDENKIQMEKAFETVWEALQAHSDRFTPLPYPANMNLNHFVQMYTSGGAITKMDLALCLVHRRLEMNLSQRELAGKTKISHSVLSRLEAGKIERVYFEYIVRLDKVLKMDGTLLGLTWACGEYESGISLLKNVNEKNQIAQKLYYTDWESTAKAWADAFITICRWHYVNKFESMWWPDVQRDIGFYK